MAAVISQATGLPVPIEPGNRGEFTVWVGDQVVAKKTLDGFPEADDCLAAVQGALSG